MNAFRTVACSTALCLLLASASSAPQASAAEDTAANIPGVTWPGPSVTSRVGGAVYDRVWRLTLIEPRLVVISLAGASGSQLGLYLFDSTANTIADGVPIGVSAKPGGSQSLSIPLQAGTYYVDVNGRNPDRSYGFNLSILTIPDRSPPFLTFTIADGRGLISDPDSTITINARDTLSGVTRVRTRIDNGAWSDWTQYLNVMRVSFEAVEGQHLVEVEAENGLGLVSETVRTTVGLDLTPPVAEVISPITTDVNVPRPSIRLKFNEAMNARSMANSGVTLVDVAGARVPGVNVYDSTARTLLFTPSVNLLPGVTYLFQLNTPTDVAGNLATLLRPGEIQYVTPTRLANMRAIAPIVYGSSAQLRARVIGISDGEVVFVESLNTAQDVPTWEVAAQTTVRRGYVQSSVAPSKTTRYRFRYMGDEGRQASASKYVTVGVRPILTLTGAGLTRSATRGSEYQITGEVQPGGTSVTMIRYRCTSTFSVCTREGSVVLQPSGEGRVEYLWSTPESSGAWRWVMRVATSETYAYSQSVPLRIRVR